jgi:HK97 family phage portal protein
MRLFGYEIAFTKSLPPPGSTLVGDRGRWWWPVVREPFTGAWQRNREQSTENVLANAAVYACIDRIASDIAKCRLRLVEQDDDGIWNEIDVPAFTPVLRKPNAWQTRIGFIECWIISKLTYGNTYILKERDNRGVVNAMYVLDPLSVRVLVAPTGDVYYELYKDNLAGLETDRVVVPAAEMMHDMMTVKFHPLCGIPPLLAATAPATQGLNIQNQSSLFFKNNATPGGVLSAPGEIKEATAKRLKEYWQTEFTGDNAGKIAVLGDGLKFEPMMQTAQASQAVEQLGLTAKLVCAAFGVPAYMVGADSPPSYNNIESLRLQYYSQTLQKFFEAAELLLDEGLGLTEISGKNYGTEFDLDDLLRMDTRSLIESINIAVKAGIMKPNEGRKKLNYGPVEGGDAAYLQQQNYSLEALAKRDAKEDPFAPAGGGGFGGGGGEAPASITEAGDIPQLAAPSGERKIDEVISIAEIEASKQCIRSAVNGRLI